MRNQLTALTLVLAVTGSTGCQGRAEGQAGSAGTTSAELPRRPRSQLEPDGVVKARGDSELVFRISRAVCNNMLVCGDVGPEQRLETLDACWLEASKEVRVHIRELECGPNADGAGSTCEQAILARGCLEQRGDIVDRVAFCRSTDACHTPPASSAGPAR